MKAHLAAMLAPLAIAATACGGDSQPSASDTASQSVDDVETGGVEAVADADAEVAECGRDAESQVSCFVRAFKLKECDAAQVLGSMFRANDAADTYEHRTAYGLDNACLADLEGAAKRRNLRENEQGELVARRKNGYREKLIIGLQVSPDGTVVEWERTQE
ncbi:MAG: hypothetical protein QNJ15_00805 [Erythrobacter sp.]|nr:hypothetical protein [Erythrobacter sp.]